MGFLVDFLWLAQILMLDKDRQPFVLFHKELVGSMFPGKINISLCPHSTCNIDMEFKTQSTSNPQQDKHPAQLQLLGCRLNTAAVTVKDLNILRPVISTNLSQSVLSLLTFSFLLFHVLFSDA